MDRYGVVRHADRDGDWYAVVDKAEHRDVAHTRSRGKAHATAERLNADEAVQPA